MEEIIMRATIRKSGIWYRFVIIIQSHEGIIKKLQWYQEPCSQEDGSGKEEDNGTR